MIGFYEPAPRPEMISLVASTTFATWTNLPSAVGLFQGFATKIVLIDTSRYTHARLRVNKTSVAGSSGSKLAIRYHTAYTQTAATYSQMGASADIACAVDSAGTYVDSGRIQLAAGARGLVYVALVGYGGDGATSPQFGLIIMELS